MSALVNPHRFGIWTPAALPAGVLSAWYDASVMSSLFQDTAAATPVTAAGDPVGRWNDQTTNGYNVTQATSTARPVLRQDANSKWYLELDATDDRLSFTGTALDLFRNQPQNWLAVAAFTASIAAGTPTLVGFTIAGSNNSIRYSIERTAATLRLRPRRLDADSVATLNASGSLVASTPFVVVTTMDWSTGGGVIRRNGVAASNASLTTAGNTSDTASSSASFARLGSAGTPFWGGGIYAALVGRTLPSAGEITNIEAWLAAKAGVTI